MKMHADEITIDVALVHSLITEQFPQWAHLPLSYVPSSGTDHALYRLGSDMAIRLPRVPYAAQQIDKEFEWLPKLAQYLSLAIPTPFAKGMPTRRYPYPWLIMKWLEGKNGTETTFDRIDAAKKLGQFINELKSVDTTHAPQSHRNKPLYTYDAEVRTAISQATDMIDTTAVTVAWNQALNAPAWNEIPVWIHSDLHAGNILVNDSKLTAVIDFGLAGLGDPACDIAVAWTLLDVATRKLFRSIATVDDATWERSKGWALRFVGAIPYYKHTNPPLIKIALHTINQILMDQQE